MQKEMRFALWAGAAAAMLIPAIVVGQAVQGFQVPRSAYVPGEVLAASRMNELRTRFTQALDNAPYPSGGANLTATFTSNGGALSITVSGSAFSNSANTRLGVDILLDGTNVGGLRVFSNEASSHKAFPTRSFLVTPAAGSHTLILDRIAGTAANQDDFWTVTVTEFGP